MVDGVFMVAEDTGIGGGSPVVLDGDGAAEEGFELVALGLFAGAHGVEEEGGFFGGHLLGGLGLGGLLGGGLWRLLGLWGRLGLLGVLRLGLLLGLLLAFWIFHCLVSFGVFHEFIALGVFL